MSAVKISSLMPPAAYSLSSFAGSPSYPYASAFVTPALQFRLWFTPFFIFPPACIAALTCG